MRGYFFTAGFMRALAGIAASVLIASAAMAELVSTNAAEQPLPPSTISPIEGPNYVPLDISAGGRYVLFSNYQPAPYGSLTGSPLQNCTIYRKDRNTGELITVFESQPETRYYCNGARMSDNGNVVVAPPASAPTNPAGEIIEIDGKFVLSYGNVVALTVKNINSNSQTDIPTDFSIVYTSNELARIQLGSGSFPGELSIFSGFGLSELSADGDIAILARIKSIDGTLGPVATLVDIEASTVHQDFMRDVDFGGVDADYFFGAEVAVSGDGDTLAFTVSQSFGLDANANAAIECGSPGRCDYDWSSWPAPPPTEYRSYLIDRRALVATELTDLRVVKEFILGVIQSGPVLRSDSLSRDGNLLTWL